MEEANLIELTAEIVSAHVSNNQIDTAEVPALIANVHRALAAATAPQAVEAERPEPAVSIKASIRPDYLVCLEDGAKVKMLKRYLSARFGLTPDEYRRKWGLPRDYPMVAPNYAEKRKQLALAIGLGRKKPAEPVAKTRKPRARKAETAEA
ncbi:MucR family transcriptional regulator [Sphingomonas morindae]|uniref:MucR family transcriptional regulator n=1 Tax=Sphingomonas morindae TaxID=1541170 RepID=A0ABY4XD95_9SPHN|nr:MucR family transcriptional regulator [Sphingomonas morindae]USI74877.1 MucR family transcriptional regulator [Sphingomonas morindae]